jgi:MerR family transcriptional regulator, light-induced transcriptional regulator
MSAQDSRWRIKEFAEIVGVPEATLRAWERRYGLMQPDRTQGGFRLYSRTDERRIRSMQAHMARGIAAAEAAGLALSEAEVEVVPPSRPAVLVEALLLAAEAFDASRFDALLDAAFGFGRLIAIRDVVLPALVEIGVRWESTDISVGHEHFASHLIERRLLSMAKGWEAGQGPQALLACPSGERHTLGLVCFGLLLADRGWRIAYLGADTPVEQVMDCSATIEPDLVILCALDARHFTGAAAAIEELARRYRSVLAGAGASQQLAKRVGAELAGDDPVAAAHALSRTATSADVTAAAPPS